MPSGKKHVSQPRNLEPLEDQIFVATTPKVRLVEESGTWGAMSGRILKIAIWVKVAIYIWVAPIQGTWAHFAQ
jgi:hypothetical protein